MGVATELKKANGEVLRIIDGAYVVGAGGACEVVDSPCGSITKRVLSGAYLLEECDLIKNPFIRQLKEIVNVEKITIYASLERERTFDGKQAPIMTFNEFKIYYREALLFSSNDIYLLNIDISGRYYHEYFSIELFEFLRSCTPTVKYAQTYFREDDINFSNFGLV